MGFNIYVKVPDGLYNAHTRGESIAVTERRLHIGKSSGGWAFGLHVIPELGLNTWADWEGFLAVYSDRIYIEYGARVTLSELRKTICDRQGNPPTEVKEIWPSGKKVSWDTYVRRYFPDAFFDKKFNLFRRKADGFHCLGNGPGSYDLIQGEFA